MTNFIGFELSFSKTYINRLFENALDSAVSSEPLEVNGVEVTLKRIGEANVDFEDKRLNIVIPLSIDLKRSAGLFTVEGSGSIKLHLEVDYNITKDFLLKTSSNIKAHEWIDKPVLELGSLNIPVETLVNLVLKHHESVLTAKIDSSIKKFQDLKSLMESGIETAKKKISEQKELKDNKFYVKVENLGLVEPRTINDALVVSGFANPEIRVNTPPEMHYKGFHFDWVEEEKCQKGQLNIPLRINYDIVEKELKNQLQGVEVGGKFFDIKSIDIKGGEKLNIEMEIYEPIKAQIFIEGDPIYNEIEGVLRMNDLDVKVNPSNLIYKLTAPLVNRFIESKMNDFFPVNLNKIISDKLIESIPKTMQLNDAVVGINYNRIFLSSMKFEEKELVGVASAIDLCVKSEFK